MRKSLTYKPISVVSESLKNRSPRKKLPLKVQNNHATIEEPTILPAPEQGIGCVRVCQMLSNCYRNIELFRFDPETGIIYIFSGEELQILIFRDGTWRFL